MGRTYEVVFESVSVSAAQDLLQIVGAASKVLRIKRVWVNSTDTTIPTSQQISVRCRYLPVTVSNGSGGSTPTPRPVSPGDAAASFTALANSTSKATTNGTAAILYENGAHIYGGDSWSFPTPPEIIPSTSFVYELLSTVSGTVHLSGGCEVEEIG